MVEPFSPRLLSGALLDPQRMFGSGSLYQKFHCFWLIGAALPILFWVLVRKCRVNFVRHLNAPVMLGAMNWLPPATPLSFSSWAIIGLIFNYFIKRRYHGWWQNYNYVTAAGLDAGLIIATIVVFFAITLPNVTIPQWFGNVGVFETSVCSCLYVFRSGLLIQWNRMLHILRL